jgi:hypothetical protein
MSVSANTVIGWDIGGVNTKVARVERGDLRAVCGRPFELQLAPHALTPLLRELAREIGVEGDVGTTTHAVTMTAELSQMFRTKREGVGFVLDAMELAFPSAAIRVFTVKGCFLAPVEARQLAIDVAAANWAATARVVAARYPDVLLIDIGTTTTDIIPIVGGDVVVVGRTDPERLRSGELVYTGVLRTPTEAIADHVDVGGEAIGVSAEGFALSGDVHLWRGDLDPMDYSVPTPDGRPPTREFAGERLARVICADRELLDEDGIAAVADSLAAAQVARIAAAIDRVRARHPPLGTAVVTGLGAFLGAAAARTNGLEVVALAAQLGNTAARCAPAVAVALLLEQQLARERATVGQMQPSCATRPLSSRDSYDTERAAEEPPRSCPHPARRFEAVEGAVDIVVKVGGSLLSHSRHLEIVLAAVGAAVRTRRLVVVPGGGLFADTVRNLERQFPLGDDAAHWMAVLGMDQYAQLLSTRLECAAIVDTPSEIGMALDRGQVPVLAPSRWLRAENPLPHTWDVTSDSIAAWVAGRTAAYRLVLVKPPGARLQPSVTHLAGSQGLSGDAGELVDAYFARVLPTHVEAIIVAADQVDQLRSVLNRGVDKVRGLQ